MGIIERVRAWFRPRAFHFTAVLMSAALIEEGKQRGIQRYVVGLSICPIFKGQTQTIEVMAETNLMPERLTVESEPAPYFVLLSLKFAEREQFTVAPLPAKAFAPPPSYFGSMFGGTIIVKKGETIALTVRCVGLPPLWSRIVIRMRLWLERVRRWKERRDGSDDVEEMTEFCDACQEDDASYVEKCPGCGKQVCETCELHLEKDGKAWHECPLCGENLGLCGAACEESGEHEARKEGF